MPHMMWINLEVIMLSETSQSLERQVSQELTSMRCAGESDSQGSRPGGLGQGNGWLFFHRYRVSVLQDEKVLEIRCTTMCMYFMLLACTLEDGEDGKFNALCLLLQLRKPTAK